MISSVVKISPKGQITIPAAIRKSIHGDTLVIFMDRDEIGIKPIDIKKIVTGNKDENHFWLKASESAMDFWDNPEDEIWNTI